jgi:predicted branched-subunit amino acid permease
MDRAKPNRNPEDRWTAVVSAINGLYWLVQGVLAHLDGLGWAAWMFAVFALIFLGLAVPVYRGSDEAALAVVGTFLVLMLISVLAAGFRALFPWQVIMAAMLWVARRGGFAQGAPRPGRAGRRW